MSARQIRWNLRTSIRYAQGFGRYGKGERFECTAFMVKHDEEAGHEWWREA